MAAFDKVRKRGVKNLPKLIKAAQNAIRTDLPLSRMNDLFTLHREVDLAKAKKVVFGPKACAVRATGFDYHLLYPEVQGVDQEVLPEGPPDGRVARGGRAVRVRAARWCLGGHPGPAMAPPAY